MRALLHYLLRPKGALLFLFILLCLLRAQTFFTSIYNGDEANYAAHASLLLKGGLPYVDFVEKKPPLIYYFYGLSYWLFGPYLTSVHFLTTLWLFTGILALYFLVYHLFGATSAFASGLCFTVFSSSFIDTEIFATNCEILMIVPLIFSTYFLFMPRKGSNNLWLILSGIFCSLGFLFKHQAGINLVVIFIHLILSKRLKDCVWVLCGFLFPVAITVLVYAHLGKLQELYEWNILFNFVYVGGAIPFHHVLITGLVNTIGFVAANLLPFFLTFLLLTRLKKLTAHYDKTQTHFILFCFLWLFLSFIPVAMGGRFYGHYYIQLYPPLSLLAGMTAGKFFIQGAPNKKWRAVLLGGLLLPLFTFQALALLRLHLQSFDGVKNYHGSIASTIDSLSSPDDKIFVWGNYSQAYFFSQRLPASRFVISEYLVPYWNKFYSQQETFDEVELSPLEKNQLGKLLDDLQRSAPRLILDTSTSSHFPHFKPFQLKQIPALNQWIQSHYKIAAVVEGVTIYSR